jgi:hypothetical protein
MRLSALARHLPVVLVFVLFVGTGLRGIDFGYHWDEGAWQIYPVKEMVTSGVLLPRTFIYPSFALWVTLAPALDDGVRAGLEGRSARGVQRAIANQFDRPEYLFEVRGLFLVVSALAIVWIYLAVLAGGGVWWEALFASAALGLSWEYAYHARWVATDCLLAQFSALTLLCIALFQRTKRMGWLYAAAVAAGLGTGTKYPGVVLLAPVTLAGMLALPLRRVLPQLFRAATLGATAFAAYLVTTPGTLLKPFSFYAQLRGISEYYATGHHGYSVAPGLPHLRLVLEYFLFDFFSPYHWLAVACFVAVGVGAVLRVRDDKRLGAVLISLPLLFLAFFCWSYGVFIVRNFLLIAPFLAVLASRTIREAFSRLPARGYRRALAGLLVGVALLQGAWLWSAAESVRHLDPAEDARRAVSWVAERSDTRFRVSDKVRALAELRGTPLPVNAHGGPDAQAVVFFARAEGPDPTRWTVNDPWLTEAVFGPREVNFNWYSNWEGHDRVVVMTIDKARDAGVPLAE